MKKTRIFTAIALGAIAASMISFAAALSTGASAAPSDATTNVDAPTATPTATPYPGTMYVSPATQQIAAGATFTVTVKQNSPIQTCCAQFDLRFDPSLVQLVSVQLGAGYSGANLLLGAYPDTAAEAIAKANDASNADPSTRGLLPAVAAAFLAPGVGAATGDQDVVVLSMQATANAFGRSPISIVNPKLIKTGLQNAKIGVIATDGVVVIGNNPPTWTPSPTATSTQTPTPTETTTPTETSTPTPTGTIATSTNTSTPTQTLTPTNTFTSTPTFTGTPPTSTNTPTPTPTKSPTPTPSVGVLTPTNTVVAGTGSLAINPAAVTVPPDTDFTVLIDQTINSETTGTQANLAFDPALVQIVSLEKSPAYARGSLAAGVQQTVAEAIAEANSTGLLKNAGEFLTPPNVLNPGTNTFLTIHMHAKAGASGTSHLTLSEQEMQAGDEAVTGAFTVTVTNGSVTVQVGAPTPVPVTPVTAAPVAGTTAAARATTVAQTTGGRTGTTTNSVAGVSALPKTGEGSQARRSLLALALAFLAIGIGAGGIAATGASMRRR
jgi:hypothetical protein